MCNLSKGVREEGIQQGIQQGRKETLVESIANLMRNMKLTCDQAMDALGIPEADKAWYAKKLGKISFILESENYRNISYIL